ncbi:MAG TPA: sulfotransferase [Acetobacteraceae bacterium]|nr:sulfotransferase [Acetobacteraceae bacterium]
MADQAPFFIVGAGRSGTTLLRLILAGHSRLHIPPETWFLRPLVRDFPLTGALTQPQVERAIETMVRHERWPDMHLAADDLRRQAAALARPALVDLIDLVYHHLLNTSSRQRLGDKTPHYFAIVPELATLYPRAKFIHLVRDGRDVAISWIDAGWQRYYEPGFEWPAAIARLRMDRTAYPDRTLEVRYEDLVRHPAEVAQHICGFLGETFEPSMLGWQDRIELVAARDRHLHARLRQPLSDDAIAVWRHRLSTAECFAMEACLHRELVQSAYKLRFAARGWQPLFRLTAGLLRTLAPVLRHGIPYLQRRRMLPKRVYL